MFLRFLRIVFITDPLVLLCFILMGATTFVAWLARSGTNLHYRAARFCARLLLIVSGVKLETSGLDRIPQKGGCVIVSNHLSLLDTPVLMACNPVPFRFLAKDSLFRVPVVGWHLRCGGHIRVVRGHARSSAKALAEAGRVLRDGISVWVFAEGSRSGSGLRTFKAGAAHAAIKAGAPVVPVAVAGTDKLLPRGSMHIRPGRARVHIGEPIQTAGLASQDPSSLTEQLRASVSELIAQAESYSGR